MYGGKLDAPVYCEQYDYDRPDKRDPSITSQPDIVKKTKMHKRHTWTYYISQLGITLPEHIRPPQPL